MRAGLLVHCCSYRRGSNSRCRWSKSCSSPGLMFRTGWQVLAPRFMGPVAGAMTSHPLLTLQNWDPWMPIKQLAAQLRTFLQVRFLEP